MKERPCSERIGEHLEDRLDDLRTLWALYEKDCDASDEDLGNMYDYGLSFDYVAPDTFNDQPQPYFRYQISWGGPSEEFRFYPNHLLERPTVFFAFLDWFDGATRELSGTDLELMREIWDWFADTGTVAHLLEQEELEA